MFKIEDIAMMIKSFSEKRFKKTLNIRDMSFDENLSHDLYPNRYRGSSKKCGYMLYFKIRQTVNQEEFCKRIYEAIIEECAGPLDLYYYSKWYDEPQIRDSFRIVEVGITSKNGGNVGVRGNVNYIKIEVSIVTDYDDDDIEFKVKTAIRDLKMAQLRI